MKWTGEREGVGKGVGRLQDIFFSPLFVTCRLSGARELHCNLVGLGGGLLNVSQSNVWLIEEQARSGPANEGWCMLAFWLCVSFSLKKQKAKNKKP